MSDAAYDARDRAESGQSSDQSSEQSSGPVGLVLSGGGARGAYQVGVLKAVSEALPGTKAPFAIVTGVSVGAVNTLALVSQPRDFAGAVARLEAMWRGMSCERVYRTDVRAIMRRLAAWAGSAALGRLGVAPPDSLLDNAPLKELLEEACDLDAMRGALDDGTLRAVAVTASDYRTGQAVAFYDAHGAHGHWQRSRRTGLEVELGVDHVMASTALPLVFPAQRVGDGYFGDGALRQTSPLSPAIHLGAARLLVIGGRDGAIDAPPARAAEPTYPSTGTIAGQLLDIVFNDHLDADLERLERVNETLGQMAPDRRAAQSLRRIDVLTLRPSQDVRQVTAAHIRDMPRTVALLLRLMGAMKPPYVLPSYLMFEPGYVGALIDLGYADARARADEIAAFFAAPRRD
ncbi:MAG: patatin-like phospholipase family protein [Pseudomonadota bacterium]